MEAINYAKQNQLVAILSASLTNGESNTLSKAEIRLYNQMIESMAIAVKKIDDLQNAARERFVSE